MALCCLQLGGPALRWAGSCVSSQVVAHHAALSQSIYERAACLVPFLQATSLPLTTFAQNNGVIALTGVASRQAGWACAIWLFLFGVFGKIGGIITSIPDW
jgi:xanthine/uracil permease